MALPTEWSWIEDLIAEEGRSMTITIPGSEQDANKPWRGNVAGTPTTGIGVFVRYKTQEIDNDQIKRGDQKVLIIPSESINIEEGTKIEDSLDNSIWTVKNIDKITNKTDILLYILQVRQ